MRLRGIYSFRPLYVGFSSPSDISSWYFLMWSLNRLFTHNCWLVHEVLNQHNFADMCSAVHIKSIAFLLNSLLKSKQFNFIISFVHLLPCLWCRLFPYLPVLFLWLCFPYCLCVLLVCITHLTVSFGSAVFVIKFMCRNPFQIRAATKIAEVIAVYTHSHPPT